MASLNQRKITESGTTNPSKLSTKIRDTGVSPDRGVNYEEPPAKGSSAVSQGSKLTYANKIVQGSVETPILTITGR
jgi:hypothetical protein